MRVFAIAAAFLFSAAAQANEARTLLDQAVAVAETHKATRYAFTLVYTDLKAPAAKSYTLRFDPRLPEGKRWSLLKPAEEALTKEERKRLKTLLKANDADDRLIYERLAPSAKEARLVAEDADTATFVGAVRDKDTPDSLARAVDMTMVLDKAGGYLRTISVKSKAAFKPAPVAKVERMTQIQSYEPIAPGGPALLRKAESSAAGEAMFKKFDQHVTMEYRDFERVAPDQVAAGK
ncbi:MAG: hypothetical protein ABL957_00645 [Parvularculaceae bacterium]